MKSVQKLITFLKKNRMLERLNKETGKWEEVELDLSDDDMYLLLQTMSAELEIMVKIEEMQLELRIKEEEECKV
jgi:hypothetical protein|tara:strand:- start:1941 stop:2162 length:222 start_codon:yes stop_codon:yes gene_type:complete